MIVETKAYQVGTLVFPTIQEAQQAEIIPLLKGLSEAPTAASMIVAHTDEIVAILTCTPKSKGPRKPRSDLGKKRAKKDETPVYVPNGLK
jgi:hypothetical protein